MQNSIQWGNSLSYTATSDVKGGDLIKFASCVGVAMTDIVTDELGTVSMVGVFELEKGSAAVFAQGDAVYVDDSGNLTATATDNVKVGIAWESSASGDDTAIVKINV